MAALGSRVVFKDIPGTVQFVGETQFAAGLWIGVELDTCEGKNDGSVKGVQYFSCADGFGIFVRESMLAFVDGGSHLSTTPSSLGSHGDEQESLRLKMIVQKLQDKLQTMHTEMDQLKSAIQELDAERDSLMDKLAKHDDDFEVMAIDKETLEVQVEILKQEIKLLTKVNESLQRELAALKEEIQLSQDVKGSSMDLVTRNETLERALIKLRDRTQELEQELEKALIEAKSSEMSSHILEEHKQTQRQLEETQRRLQELELLRKEEKDLESIHIDTENELQAHIDSLETIIGEKQNMIATLERSNKELTKSVNVLKSNSTSVVEHRNTEESRIQLANTKQDNRGLRLDLDVLQRELKLKEDVLMTLIDSPSVNIHQLESRLMLIKYSDTLQIICKYITPGEDLYVNILGEVLKFQLCSLGLLLSHLTDVYGTSSLLMQVSFDSLETAMDELMHAVKEEQYRTGTNLERVGEELLSQLIDVPSPFQNLFELKLSAQLQELCCSTTISLIGLIKSKSIRNNIEITPEVSHLFKAVSKHQNWCQKLLIQLEAELQQNNEVSQVRLQSLEQKVMEFSHDILRHISSGASESSEVSLVKELNILLNGFQSAEKDVNWESQKVIKQNDAVNFESTEEVSEEHSTQANKIEEYEAKIEVLKTRLSTTKETERLMRNYKTQYEGLLNKNIEMDTQLKSLMITNEQLNMELTKAKNNNLLYNAQFESLLEQKKHTDHVDLVSEIHSLRNAVRHYTAAPTKTLSWIREEWPRYDKFDAQRQVNELRTLGKFLQGEMQRKLSLSH